MAAFLSDNLAEIFLNSDSEDEFEGFDLQDLEEVGPPVEFDNFDVAHWRRGDRPELELEFRATPGLRLGTDLGDGQFLDYFKLFFKDQDFETMAEETNRYAKQYPDANRGNLKKKSRFKSLGLPQRQRWRSRWPTPSLKNQHRALSSEGENSAPPGLISIEKQVCLSIFFHGNIFFLRFSIFISVRILVSATNSRLCTTDLLHENLLKLCYQ